MWDMIVGIFRSILFFIDGIIYSFIPSVYYFIKILAIQKIFEPEIIQQVANNIYAILGVFMLFRLAFVLLNAIVDPDKLTNKEKGFGKIMTRVVTSLVLIVAIPYVFELAYGLQAQILEKNIVEKIILGKTSSGGSNYGQQIAKLTLQSFYKCNPKANDYIPNPTDPSGCQYELEYEYYEAFPTDNPEDNNVNLSFFSEYINEKSGNVYKYEYSALISTITGIMVLGLLILFTFDIGMRAVKLGFLQLITPVAVIGYIEPGGGIFKKWQDMCIKTYINLFIRILAISFVVLVVSILSNSQTQFVDFNGEPLTGLTHTFVVVFIILGALMFAKEAPKMLSNMFGLEEGSLGSLNPFKKMAGAGLIGGLAAGGFKAAGGVFGGVSGGIAAKTRGGSFWAGAGQGAKEGFGNIKIKDAIKGGFGGLGKTLWGGTLGAAGKGGSYAAGKVTGKEEKVGPVNWMKSQMAAKAQEMHTGHAEKDKHDMGESLRKQINKMAGKTPDYTWSRGNKTAYESAKEKAEATKQMFSNKEFADAYEKSKVAAGLLKDEQELLTTFQNQLSLASAKYQNTNSAADLAEVSRLQGVVTKQTKTVSDYEDTSTLYKNEFEELSKKDYNKKDVEKLEALEAYDKSETAKKRIDQ